MAREFEIRREVELPATPERVWEAVATSAGNQAWLFPNEVPAGEGATSADGTKVTAWDPPRHFAVRMDGPDGWFNAIEEVIEARDGGTTVMRYVHSGIFVDDWDTQYDAASQHTDFYLHTLGQYLAHFAGRRATYIGDSPGGVQGPAESAQPGGFDRLRAALGLGDGASEGDSVAFDVDGIGRVEGVVDYARENFLGVRTADGLYRFFGRNAFGMPVGLQVHSFAEGVDADASKQALGRWLNGVYA
jgi:uncharacterized protein YndB with AHSA1/START domain